MSENYLPNYLKMYRLRAGLSQKEVSSLLGTKDGPRISRYESGTAFPSLHAILALEIIFQLPATELFKGITEEILADIQRHAEEMLRTEAPSADSANARKVEFLKTLINQLHATDSRD